MGENTGIVAVTFRGEQPIITVYRYPCPGCRSTSVLHRRDCRFEGTDRTDIERAHVTVIAALATGPRDRSALRRSVDGQWSDLHEATVRMLEQDARLERTDGEQVQLVPPDEIADRIEPTEDPLRTIYEVGSVAGAHDNSVFAMVAYYASKGLSWEDTRRQVLQWLDRTGTWARGGFEEPSPEVLVDDKRHVHEEGYGWLEKARAAKAVIDNSNLVT